MDFSQVREMMANAQKMREDVEQKMDATIVEASSGGGLVTARMNGRKQVLSVKIDPIAVDPRDIEMLQDLVTAAVNAAGAKADEAMRSHIQGIAGGLNLPGLL